MAETKYNAFTRDDDEHGVSWGGIVIVNTSDRKSADLVAKTFNLHKEFAEALKAVLLFHSGVAWDYKAKIEWSKLVGPDNEATTKGMCDNIRTVLAKAG